MRQVNQSKIGDSDLNRVQEVIREFLAKPFYEELWETRIQKLIFYTEVYCVVYYEARMTKANYKPYMFGAYSPDINTALEQMEDLNQRRMIRNGKRTVAYSLGSDGERLDTELKPIIDRVHDQTMNKSTDQLAQFSKNNWLFEHTEYDHPMDFNELAEALEDHSEIKEDLKSQLPEKADVDEEKLIYFD
jgi:uncharacterized protein YwgA